MAESKLPLRDFDEESETDSETELLIRRDVPSGKINSSGSSNHNNNFNSGRRRNSSMGYSGVDVDVGASSSAAGGRGSFLGNLFGSHSFGSAAGQIRYRNERSRERAKNSNGIYSSISKLAQLTHTSSGVAGAGSVGGSGTAGGIGGIGVTPTDGVTTAGVGAAGSSAPGDHINNGGTHSTIANVSYE